ncbi:uncharacterized protein [Dermacentor andersoni]|uniref:uncharacterized protein n=1 Tax=Dermacentor andersoni TaxID=34620 RepID=UPI002155BF9E|nr:uncharacterized protein LOC126528341 [Dermacentor andersoni]
MDLSEALPYRVAVGNILGVSEYRSVLFVEALPPKRLVCSVCRTVSATEPRYSSPASGDVMCWACAQDLCLTALGEVVAGSASGPSADHPEWPKPSLALREPAVEGDVELLKDLEVLCPNADLECGFRGKFRVLPIHLSSTCAHDFILCRGCGDRVLHRDFYEHLELRGCLKSAAAAVTGDGFQLTWGPSSLLYREANATQKENGSASNGAAAENSAFIREVGEPASSGPKTPVGSNGAAATAEDNGGRILRLPILLWEAVLDTDPVRPDVESHDDPDSSPVILEVPSDDSDSSTNAVKNGTGAKSDEFVVLDKPRSPTDPSKSGTAEVDDDPPVWIPTPLRFEPVFGKSEEWDDSKAAAYRKDLAQRQCLFTGKLLVRFPDRSSYRARSARTGTLHPRAPAEANAAVENRGEDELALDGFRLKGLAHLFDYDPRGRGASSSASGTELATFELLARDAGEVGERSGGLKWPAARSVALTLNGFCSGNSRLRLRTRHCGEMQDIPVGEEWTKVAVTYPVDAATVWKEFAVLDIVELTVELK